MKSNILFILIDGLRADQCYGDDKKSHTPFLDSLIKTGLYFNNVFSSADGTIISLNGLFNSKFQYETGIRSKRIIFLENNHLQKLKEENFHIFGLIPKLTSLSPLSEFFENEDNAYEPGPPPQTLSNGMSEKILKLLNSIKDKSPWFCYIHLFDLHPLREGRFPLNIQNFNYEKFGNSPYSRTVSSIDYWLMEILKKIDFNNTTLILTADHGERIPFDDKISFQFEPELKQISTIGKKILPSSTHNIGGKTIGKFRQIVGKTKVNFSNSKLSPYQIRSRDPYFTLSLHDELLHIPLLIKGKLFPKKIISQQISNLNIFPIIFDALQIPYENSKYITSLSNLLNDNENPENVIFLHTMPYEKESEFDLVGIRTPQYKYFRHSRNPHKNVTLYDLKNDPYENCNIYKSNTELIKNFENLIIEMKNKKNSIIDEISPEDEEIISKELKDLGYL